jgi:DnaJ-class molecular chaperone
MTSLPQKESFFSYFNLEPRPALDLEMLKECYAKLSAELHPDKFVHSDPEEKKHAQARFSSINLAYQTLREPKERLLHLYTLERGVKPQDIQRIPSGTMDLFVEVGQLCQKIDSFFKERAQAASALAKAQLIAQGLELQDAILTTENKMQELEQRLNAELLDLDTRWSRGDKSVDALETLYRKYSYMSRWKQQLEERKLAFLTQ